MTVMVIGAVIFVMMDNLILRAIRVSRSHNHWIDNHRREAMGLLRANRRPLHAIVADHRPGISEPTAAGIVACAIPGRFLEKVKKGDWRPR